MSDASSETKPAVTEEEKPSTVRQHPERRRLWWWSMQQIVNLVGTIAYRLDTRGMENIPATGGVLLVSNHQSFLDPPMLAVRLPRAAAFLARSGLFKNPIFSRLIRSLNAFPIRQGSGDVGAVKQTIELLQNGWLVMMFPEGSRTPDGEIKPVQKGIGLLVRRAGVPVVPAVIDGAYDAWSVHRKVPRLGKLRVRYGPPMDLTGLKADEIRQRIDETLAKMLADLRAEK